MSRHLFQSNLDKAAGKSAPSDRVKHVKHRSCTSCGKARPAVVFPKMPNGAYRKKCQLCVDTAKRSPKDVLKLRAASLKADRSRKKLEAARLETVGEERETV